MLQRYVAVGCARHVHHARAARLLGVPDLCVGGKLEVAEHDLVARPVKSKALASALMPAEAEAVTAISSGLALSTRAMATLTASFFVTHTSQLAPTSSRSSM